MKPLFSTSLRACFLLIVTLTACNKISPLDPVSPLTTKNASTHQVFSVMDMNVEPVTGNLNVIFHESQRIFSYPSNGGNYNAILSTLEKGKANGQPIEVFFSMEGQLDNVLPATKDEVSVFNLRFTETETTRDIYEEVIPSMEKLNEIFAFIQEQNCADGNAVIDYCIPFQFKIDGCYARAHKMKQIMETDYGYTCSKIFSFAKNLHPLAVDGGDCCVFWGWHDAPVVKVNTSEGITQMVVDPSLFDHPVSIQHWLSVQSTPSCDPKSGAGSYKIVPGSYYFDDGTKDPHYVSTNFVLNAYKNLKTCN